MPAATILFTDIVGFSKKSTAEQKRLVDALTGEVIYESRLLLNPPLETPSLVALPTGDGAALVFLHRQNQGWELATIFHLLLKIQIWASNEINISLRIGVHVGPVELITDVNGKPNICGDAVNYAQRVMDAANPKQVLFSEAAFREYIGTETHFIDTPPFSKDLKAEFLGPIEVYAKHGLPILVYKMILEPLQEWWSNDDPIAKHYLFVSLTPLPKEIIGDFSEKLGKATHIAFIQLTGDRFLANFNKGLIKFSPNLNRYWVFMPDPDTYSTLHLSPPHASADFVNECIGEWHKMFFNLKEQYPKADLKLGLFKEPPYFGASFVDWERPGGSIHISPYIWNIAAPDCPGYDIPWIGKKPSPIFDIYVRGLQYLNLKTLNIAFQD
jgi:hypothetical protein